MSLSPRVSRMNVVVVGLMLALATNACDDQGSVTIETNACERSSDCEDPNARCVAARCVMECGDARDCDVAEVCLNGVCSEAMPCRQDGDCQYDHECVAGICTPFEDYCEENRDCRSGSVCDVEARTCVADAGGCQSDDDCLSTEVCASGRCVPDVSPPACVRNSDCQLDELCTDGECVPEQVGCVTDGDCVGHAICVASRCEPECIEDRDCPEGDRCADGASAEQPGCRADADCGAGEICTAGVCGPECVEDRDCASDSRCVAGSCEIDPVNNDRPCTDDPSVCELDEECCDGTCVLRGQCPSAGDYWEACTAAAECATDLCVGGLDGNGHCTDRCGSRQECGQVPVSLCIQSYHLITQQAGGNQLVGLCYQDDSGTVCDPATTNACFDGLCVDKRVGGVPAGLCSIRCRAAADCLPGWACGIKEFSIAGATTALEVCVPIGASCSGEGAAAADQCYSGVCVTDDQTMQGFCTTICDAPQQCPLGWICVDAGGTGVCAQQ